MTLDWISLDYQETYLGVRCTYDGTQKQPIEAIQDTVLDIAKDYPPPYNLFCTDGVDSQSVLLSWTKFAPLDVLNNTYVYTFVYNENSNNHDFQYIKQFCQDLGLRHRFLDFDLINFLESGECFDIQCRYRTTSPQISAHIKMLEFFDVGTNIMSGNYSRFQRLKDLNIFSVHYALINHAKQYNSQSQNKKIIPFFYLHNSLIGTSASEPKNINYGKDFDNYFKEISDDGYRKKCTVYKYFGCDIKPQLKKYSGFENFKFLYEKRNPASGREKLIYANLCAKHNSSWAFDVKYRYPLEYHARELKNINVTFIKR